MLELRVAALLVLTAYLFTLDDYILSQCRISVLWIFGYQNASTSSPRRVARMLAMILLAGCAGVAVQSFLIPSLHTRIGGILTLTLVIFVILRQRRLTHVLKRVIRGRISSDHRLGDILVSDALVSLASVFADITLSVILTLRRVPIGAVLNRSAVVSPFIPLTASIPSAIRIKQCFSEYRSTRNKQHLLNLVKYLVGNAPNAIRLQIAVLLQYEGTQQLIREHEQRLPYVLTLSATYSLVWDIVVDWKMGRLLDEQQRTRLRLPIFSYYMAIGLDCVLRFAFMAAMPYEHVVFTLQLLEIARRGMWVVFRAESEPPQLEENIQMHAL